MNGSNIPIWIWLFHFCFTQSINILLLIWFMCVCVFVCSVFGRTFNQKNKKKIQFDSICLFTSQLHIHTHRPQYRVYLLNTGTLLLCVTLAHSCSLLFTLVIRLLIFASISKMTKALQFVSKFKLRFELISLFSVWTSFSKMELYSAQYSTSSLNIKKNGHKMILKFPKKKHRTRNKYRTANKHKETSLYTTNGIKIIFGRTKIQWNFDGIYCLWL